MASLHLGVQTQVKWINELAELPIIGHLFLFMLMFIPAVLLSFVINAFVPGLKDEVGFTKAMLVLLPGCNLVLWLKHIKLYCFFIPAWMLFGIIAIIKTAIMIAGNN